MTRKTLLPLGLSLVAAALLPATGALAAGSGSPASATASSVKIVKAYAFFDSYQPSNKKLIAVVVKTNGQLPRRFDGLIRAGGTLDGHYGGSIASVGGKASRCYTFTVPLRDGRFITTDGGKGKKAVAGSKHALKLSAKDADGNAVSSTKTITLRDKRAGDRAGKPIGC